MVEEEEGEMGATALRYKTRRKGKFEIGKRMMPEKEWSQHQNFCFKFFVDFDFLSDRRGRVWSEGRNVNLAEA